MPIVIKNNKNLLVKNMTAADTSDHPASGSDTSPKARTSRMHLLDLLEVVPLSPQTFAAAAWMKSLSLVGLRPSSRSDHDSLWPTSNCSCVVAWKQIKRKDQLIVFLLRVPKFC